MLQRSLEVPDFRSAAMPDGMPSLANLLYIRGTLRGLAARVLLTTVLQSSDIRLEVVGPSGFESISSLVRNRPIGVGGVIMRRIFLAIAAVAISSNFVLAADLPARPV